MNDLPNGWAIVSTKDVCELQNGRAFKQAELLDSGKYPVLRVGNFFSNRGWYHSNLELASDKYCESGDLLYAWSASFGPRIWSGGKVIFHYHIWRVDLVQQLVDNRFLFHWFEWDKENIKAELGTGSTMIHVTKGDMEERRLALPPLAEQRRIVAKLDALTARTARARADLDRVPALAARYKQAALSAILGATSQAAPLIPLREQLGVLTSGSRDWAEYYDRGDAIFVLAGNVKPMKFDPLAKRLVDPGLFNADQIAL